MRILVFILLGLLVIAFCKSPSFDHFRKQFPEMTIKGNDTIHFGPDDFQRELWNADKIRFYDIVLKGGTSCTPSAVAQEGGFVEPRYRMVIGNRDAFIVHTGDTTSVWIYQGRETILYMNNPVTGKFERKYILASGFAGEGPWFETDSWITDLDHDGNIDILSRDIGEWITQDSTGELIDNSVNDIRAVTWRDTGFVKMELKNEDSLKAIYRNYYWRKQNY